MPRSVQGTRIGHARIRAAGADAAALSAGCSTQLASLDLEPPAMPPHGILCVRVLHDPLPGAIDLRPGRPRQRPFAWEAAARTSLGTLWQGAVRPIDGPVPADATAVFFADETEMLACAARDVCRGPLSWCWWWRHLLPDASFERVVAAWRAAPACLPAAFESLAKLDAAASWIHRLTPSSAAALLDAMLRAHALPRLADEIAAVWHEPGRGSDTRDATPAPRPDLPAAAADRRAFRAPAPASPWRTVVPEEWDSPALPSASRTFAAMCTVLRRAPWLARSERFSRALVEYVRQVEPAAPRDRDTNATGVHGQKKVDRTIHAEAPVAREPGGADRRSDAHIFDAPVRTAATPLFDDAAREVDRHPAPDSRTAERDTLTPHRRSQPGRRADRERLARPTGEPLEARSEGPRVEKAPAGEPHAAAPLEAVDSDYAGAFFLINAAIDLELYSHGITVVDDLELSVWRFVDIVARELLGDHDPDDPLWELLGRLARPAGDLPLADAEPELSNDDRDRLVVRVRSRLTELLDDDDPGGLLIRRHGRIARTPGHVDVHFPLDRHPIEIRLARLDRNPGWIPAAGVHIAFHFD